MTAIDHEITEASTEKKTMRKIMLRIVPLLMASYFLAYLDRINIGFAALEMNKDLGLTNTVYGWAAGISFWPTSPSKCLAISFWSGSGHAFG